MGVPRTESRTGWVVGVVVVFQDDSYRRGLYPELFDNQLFARKGSRTDNVHTGMDSNVLCSCTNGDQLLDLLYDSGGDRVLDLQRLGLPRIFS